MMKARDVCAVLVILVFTVTVYGAEPGAAEADEAGQGSAASSVRTYGHWEDPVGVIYDSLNCAPDGSGCDITFHGTAHWTDVHSEVGGPLLKKSDWKGESNYAGTAHQETVAFVPQHSTFLEVDTFTGTVEGCGKGSFKFTLAGNVDFTALTPNGWPGRGTWEVIEGTGKDGLTGITGGGTSTFFFRPTFSNFGDLVGTLICHHHQQ